MLRNSKIAFLLSGLFLVFVFFLSACEAAKTPVPTSDASVFYTQAAATIVLGLTQTVEAIPTLTPIPPTPSPIPSETATQTIEASPVNGEITETPNTPLQSLTASPTIDPETAHGCYNATFIADVTIQFSPAYHAGDHFTKTWRVKNSGSCDWPRGFKIIFVSGDRFGAENTSIDQKVLAGEMADISLQMIAPELTGLVNSNWQFATDIGKSFGPILNVSITLPGTPDITQSASSCLSSELVSDVSIPTGTEMHQNVDFTKTWLIKNTGSCTWNPDFKITFVGGDAFGADSIKIHQTVSPGESAEISLKMTSPNINGIISSAWQLASDDGRLFGQLFAFSIVIK